MSRYDVIVIGSGMGGLCCGTILSKEGLRVCVVEKEPAPGGCLRSFRRDGVPFDTGMHYIGSMDDGELLNHFLRYCGVYDRLRLQRLDEAFDIIRLGDREYRFCQGYDRYCETLAEQFPALRRQIAAYAASLREVGSVIGVERLRQGIVSADGSRYLAVAASDGIARTIGDPLLCKVLAGNSFLYDGVRGRTPFYHHAMINHSFIRGACRFAGGSQQLADALCDAIRRNGGEVRCGDAVAAVRHRDNRVTGVQTAAGEVLESPCVVADIHPARLLPMLGSGTRIRPSYAARVRSAENSCGVFSLFATVDRKAFPYLNRNYYLLGDDVWAERGSAARPQTVMLSMQAQAGGGTCEGVSLLCPMPYREVAAWEATTVGHRGAGYEAFKQAKAEELIRRVGEHFPAFPASIRSVHTATPLTYRDYTGTPEGSAYGMQIDCNDVLGTHFSPATKVGGLLLTGQNVAIHGALGVVMTALATCGALLGSEYVARKIGNYGNETTL